MRPIWHISFIVGFVIWQAVSSKSPDCPFSCFLTAEKELLCTSVNSSYIQSKVACHEDLEAGRYVIGNRSSIRRVFPEGLQDLQNFAPKRSLGLLLNMNILQLTPKSFSGLEGVLTNLAFLQVAKIHPQTLANHRRISSIYFDGQKVPMLPDDFEDHSNTPVFLRLHPEDPATPIELNVDVRCHRCTNDASENELAVITFPLSKTSHRLGSAIDALTMLYVDNCPRLESGLGCPVNGSAVDYIVNASAPTGWTTLMDDSGAPLETSITKPASEGSRVAPLITSIIIWCTLLSIVLVILAFILVIARHRKAARDKEQRRLAMKPQEQIRYSPISLKRIICGTASCEDLRRASFCNGYNHWAYGTPLQTSSSNLISETRSQYSFKPPSASPGLQNLRGSRYSGDFEAGYRSPIVDFSCRPTRPKDVGINGDVVVPNGDATLPPLPPNIAFRVPGTPSYKRSHDGTFRMQQ